MRHACRPVLSFAVALLAGVAAVLASFGSLHAAEPPTTIIIFDGSGSMWGKLDGEKNTKLIMARDGLRTALAKAPATSLVGLMSFGHRRSGDCNDTEMILTPEPLDVERVLAPLDKLNPRGRGPITRALREAAAKLGPQSAPASVVLIHDGLDNCQLDPCTAIGDLRQAHPLVRVHVVALGLTPDEAQKMSCLPKATGGKLYEVANSEQANAALLEAVRHAGDVVSAAAAAAKSTQQAAAAPAIAPAQPVPAGRPGLQLWASLTKGGPAVAVPVRWRVRRAGDKGPPLWEGVTPAPLIVLPTGRYEIEAQAGLVTRQATAEAVEGQPRALAIVLDAGTLAFAGSDSGQAMLDDAVVTLARIEARGPGEPQILRQLEPELALAPGNYLVAVSHGTLRIERPIGIEVGQRVSMAGSLNLGLIELAASAVKDGPPLDRVLFTVYEDDPDAPQGRREVARSAAPQPRLKLPAGTYNVVARRGAAEVRERITVKGGESERRVIVLETGQLALTIRIPGGRLDGEGPISHRLERLDVQPRDVLNASGATAAFDVTAGRFKLETRIGTANVRSEREIRLKAGETEKLVIEHAAGSVRLRLLERAGAAPVPDVVWDVRDPRGQPVWAGLGTEGRALLLAGRYTVRAEGRGIRIERPIEVRAGEVRTIDLTDN